MNHNYEYWEEGDEYMETSISNQNAIEIETEIIHQANRSDYGTVD